MNQSYSQQSATCRLSLSKKKILCFVYSEVISRVFQLEILLMTEMRIRSLCLVSLTSG